MIRSTDTGLPPGCWTPVPAKKRGDGHHETKKTAHIAQDDRVSVKH